MGSPLARLFVSVSGSPPPFAVKEQAKGTDVAIVNPMTAAENDKQKFPGASPDCHQMACVDVARQLATDMKQGLTEIEVASRLEKFGLNRLTAKKSTSEWKRFLLQFNQPLVYILLAATIITAWLGEWVDSSVIFGVVLLNAIVGYLQEAKAEKAIGALASLVTTSATVMRGGGKLNVSSEQLVPGDVVLLESGDKVPADLRLCEVRNLKVDESALTGESVAVEKHHEPLDHDTVLADRKNLAFAGSLVTYGRAKGIVCATGDHTEMGRIAGLLSTAPDLTTPLTKKIATFSKLCVWAILALAAATFGIGLIRGEDAVEMFMAAIALAVGAIPEGLPAAVTITLAIGVSRMAKRQALIRKLPAVETLGSTTVICSDKTGTLTENQMTVQEIFAAGQLVTVSGGGYDSKGDFREETGDLARIESNQALQECLQAGLLCNDAQLSQENDRWGVQGDPTEAALIVVAEKAGLAHIEMTRQQPRLDAIPFESEHQYMATLHGGGRRGHVIYKKGAVEKVLARCTSMLGSTGRETTLDKVHIQSVADQMAARGLRVLAFAMRHASREQHQLDHQHVQDELIFLGLQGMMDPPREEAMDAIKKCQQAGIMVKMITGDHLLTAKAVARKIGLHGGNDLYAVNGHELEDMNDESLADAAVNAAVFARVAPEQKLRLVRALQSRGHVVAMTGDGVNDAPALKQADIGVAMGITGTEVAKNAADMILTNDNFRSIKAAVEEGRNVFDNLTKFIVWTLPTNIGESLVILAAIVFGSALPALPVQMLWINLATSICLGLFLVFEPKEHDLMERPPRDPKAPILTFPLLMRTGLVSCIILAGAFGLFLWERKQGSTLAESRTVVVNVLVIVELFYLLNCRSLVHSMRSLGFLSNPLLLIGCVTMVGLQMLFTYAPFMNHLFHTAPISLESWLRVLGVGLFTFSVVGFEKWVRLHMGKSNPSTS